MEIQFEEKTYTNRYFEKNNLNIAARGRQQITGFNSESIDGI